MSLRPFQRAFAPRVIISHDQNANENEHLDQSELSEREVVAHKDYRPRQQEDRLHVEDQEQHGNDVVSDAKSFVRLGGRINATFVRTHLSFFVLDRAQEPTENNRKNWEHNGDRKKDHDRPIRCDWTANCSLSCISYFLKKHVLAEESSGKYLDRKHSKRRLRTLSTHHFYED